MPLPLRKPKLPPHEPALAVSPARLRTFLRRLQRACRSDSPEPVARRMRPSQARVLAREPPLRRASSTAPRWVGPDAGPDRHKSDTGTRCRSRPQARGNRSHCETQSRRAYRRARLDRWLLRSLPCAQQHHPPVTRPLSTGRRPEPADWKSKTPGATPRSSPRSSRLPARDPARIRPRECRATRTDSNEPGPEA